MNEANEPSVFDLPEMVENIDDLERYIRALMEEMDRDPEEWGKRTLKEFLHGMSTFIDGDFEEEDKPSWNLFAEILLMGFAYS